MKIILATEEELLDLIFLNHHVQEIHHKTHPDIFKPASLDSEIQNFFKSVLKEHNNIFLIAYKHSVPLGYIWYEQRRSKESPLTYSRLVVGIHHLVVHKDYRHMNVGSKLLEKVKEHASDINAFSIELDAWNFNSGAQSFFESSGFEIYNVNMWNRNF